MPGATQGETGTGAAGGAATSRGEIVAKIGTVLSAIMASSCCWLPPLLLLVGVSSAGIVAALESYRPYFIVVTFAFLGMAFYFTYRPKRGAQAAAAGGGEAEAAADCCAPPPAGKRRRFNMMAMNKVMLWAVTAMAVVFLFFPGVVTELLGGGGKVTADMQCTEMRVIGMTCDG